MACPCLGRRIERARAVGLERFRTAPAAACPGVAAELAERAAALCADEKRRHEAAPPLVTLRGDSMCFMGRNTLLVMADGRWELLLQPPLPLWPSLPPLSCSLLLLVSLLCQPLLHGASYCWH